MSAPSITKQITAKSPNEIEEISTFVLFFIIYWVVSFVLAAGYRAYLPAPRVVRPGDRTSCRRGGGDEVTFVSERHRRN